MYAELEHCNALDTEAKGETRNLFRIISNIFEYLRMHHAGTKNFKPPGIAANTAPVTPAHNALDVYFSAGLSKRKEARAESERGIRIKNLMNKRCQETL